MITMASPGQPFGTTSIRSLELQGQIAENLVMTLIMETAMGAANVASLSNNRPQ